MESQDSAVPIYYDGSKHMAVAETGQSSDGAAEHAASASEEWRRYIGFNPFGGQE